MVQKWLADIFRSSGTSDVQSFADSVCKGLVRIGVDARAAKESVTVQGSPIARVRLEIHADSYGSNQRYYLFFEIPDTRLNYSPYEDALDMRATKIKNSRFFGKLIGIRWQGNDLGAGILDRLNNDDSLTGRNVCLLNSLGNMRIGARQWYWEIARGKGGNAPVRMEWESYERIARYVLQAPIKAHGNSQSVNVGRVALNDFPLQVLRPDQILTMLFQRSWFWRYLTGGGQIKCLERIVALQALLPTIIDRLAKQFVLERAERMTTAYLIGSYPWVQNPADTDLLIIVEGEFDWTPFTSRDLQARGVWVPELSADLALEIVGSETLLLAKAGEQVVDAERVALRHTLLYGSVLLAGRDIFESSSIRIEDLDHLRNDLLRDRKEADWPELAGDSTRIEDKRKWRKAEADALCKFRSHLPERPERPAGSKAR